MYRIDIFAKGVTPTMLECHKFTPQYRKNLKGAITCANNTIHNDMLPRRRYQDIHVKISEGAYRKLVTEWHYKPTYR